MYNVLIVWNYGTLEIEGRMQGTEWLFNEMLGDVGTL
jgi:hypothetical protein